MTWKAKFDAEMAEIKRQKLKAEESGPKKLTGYHLSHLIQFFWLDFVSRASHHVETLGKSLAHNCLWRFIVKQYPCCVGSASE